MDTFTCKARLDNLRPLLKNITDYIMQHGFKKEKINKIELAVEEVVVNIINYAYPETEGDITVNISFPDEHGMVVEIIDWGAAFDPTKKPPADTNVPLGDRKAGGLGIYFASKAADAVQYKREKDRNVLSLTIKR